MAAPCFCGAKRNHPIHLLAVGMKGAHKYGDPSKAGISPIGRDREEYLKSETHKEAYARAAEVPGCLGHMAGAPEPERCSEPLTPHHTAGRGVHGGQEASERDFPVVMLCQWLNGAIESNPQVRRWAERTTFVRDGKEFYFRYNARMIQAALRRLKESA